MIFISYRKEDSGDLSGSLAGKLAQHFGEDSVFLDRHQIEPGDRWRDEIDGALSKAVVVLAVIGPHWLTTHDEFGQRRIDRDDDVLAYELSVVLARKIAIVPLYLHGLKPLPGRAFPGRLAGLADQQGIEFDIDRDFSALCAKLEKFSGLRKLDRAPSALQEDGGRSAGRSKPWCIPDSIGSLFKGRAEAVRNLRERLLRGQSSPTDHATLRQVLFGLGGIGKTRMAIEYAWEYQDEYRAVLFVVADNPSQLRRSISDLAAPAILNLPEWKNSEEEIRMAAVIRWFSENPGWLLIVDNADEKPSVDAVSDLLPQLRGGHVIITSRYHRWSTSAVRRIELDVLPREAAKAFLLDRTSEERRKTPEDEAVADELARELGCLALALEQAGAYIQHREGGLSLADYMTRWREGKSQVRDWFDKGLMHYDRSVAATWETTMRALDPASLTLFRILAWFAPDPVPRSIVSKSGAQDSIKRAVEASGLTVGEIDSEQALSELIAYSMTRKIDEQGVACVGLHRVVLEIMRDRMVPEAKAPTVVAAAELLVLFAPKDSYRPEAWMDWRLLISHAEAIWGVLRALPEEHLNIDLLKMLALYYMGQGEEACVPIQRTVLRLVQQRLSAEDPEIFTAKNDLALMLPTEEEPEQLYREALEGRIRVHGLESIEAAETQHNLANHLSPRNPAEAESLLRQALATFTALVGPFHWRTLMTEKSLSGVLLSSGKAEEGRALLEASIKKSEQHLPDSPDTALAFNDFALMLRKEGNAAEAEKYLRLALGIDQRIRGENSPKIPHRLMNLCIALTMQSKLDEARQDLARAWLLKRGRHDITSARILFIRLAVAMMESSPEGEFIGKLKSLVGGGPLAVTGGVVVKWDIDYFIKFLQTRLTPGKSEFVTAVASALNEPGRVSDLNRFPEWRDTAHSEDVDRPFRSDADESGAKEGKPVSA